MKTIYRITLVPEFSNGLAETLAVLAAKSNGSEKPYTLEKIKTVAESEKILYPTTNENTTCELLCGNRLHLAMIFRTAMSKAGTTASGKQHGSDSDLCSLEIVEKLRRRRARRRQRRRPQHRLRPAAEPAPGAGPGFRLYKEDDRWPRRQWETYSLRSCFSEYPDYCFRRYFI